MLKEILNQILLIFLLLAPNVYLFIIFVKLKKSIKEVILPIGLLVLLLVIFLNKLLFKDQTLSAQDFNNIQIPFFHFFRESILKYGQPPVWDSRFGGGFDAFSNPISPYFSPFNFIFLLIQNVYSAANIFIFFQLLLISIFSLLLFNKLKFNKLVSIFGAVVFTFNGFVTMRLSPGVGIEYLYSYKWIPLIILFTLSYSEKRKLIDLVFVSIALALSFEGNLNIVVAIWLFWGIFTIIVLGKSILKELKRIVIVPFLAVSIYAIKILPFLDLMNNSSGRISGVVKGWRINKIEISEFWTYFPPFSHLFGSAVFTPGIVAIIFFLICLVLVTIFLVKRCFIDKILVFSILSIILGFIFTTYNPVSDLFFSLPFFNRVTIIPSFMVFIFVPTYVMSVYGLDFIYRNISRISLVKKIPVLRNILAFGISCLIFFEVLLGPSTFGKNTYSFNFAKMYKDEVFNVPPYSFIKNIPPGVFVIIGSSDTFTYPYAVSILDLYSLNNFRYFYQPEGGKELSKEIDTDILNGRVDYVLSPYEINSHTLNLIGSVGTAGITENFSSFSILDKKYDYLKLQNINNWSEKLFVYNFISSSQDKIFIKRTENHPTKIYFANTDEYLDEGKISTSIRYSKWWVSGKKNEVRIEKDDYGFIEIYPGSGVENFILYYFNPFIYLGLLISLSAFGLIIYVFVLSRKKDSS